jgi:hypothetical protein
MVKGTVSFVSHWLLQLQFSGQLANFGLEALDLDFDVPEPF